MRDDQAIAFMVSKEGTPAAAARAFGISPQLLTNWLKRGISAPARYGAREALNKRGARLPLDWLDARASTQPAKGKINGGASKAKRGGKKGGQRKDEKRVGRQAKKSRRRAQLGNHPR